MGAESNTRLLFINYQETIVYLSTRVEVACYEADSLKIRAGTLCRVVRLADKRVL